MNHLLASILDKTHINDLYEKEKFCLFNSTSEFLFTLFINMLFFLAKYNCVIKIYLKKCPYTC